MGASEARISNGMGTLISAMWAEYDSNEHGDIIAPAESPIRSLFTSKGVNRYRGLANAKTLD